MGSGIHVDHGCSSFGIGLLHGRASTRKRRRMVGGGDHHDCRDLPWGFSLRCVMEEWACQQSACGCNRFVCTRRNHHRIVRAFCSLQLPRDSDSHRGTVRNDHGVQCLVSYLARTTEDYSGDKEWRSAGRRSREACGLEITPQHVHVRAFALGHDWTAHDLFRGRQSWHPWRLLLDIPADHHHRWLAYCLSDIQEGGEGFGLLKPATAVAAAYARRQSERNLGTDTEFLVLQKFGV